MKSLLQLILMGILLLCTATGVQAINKNPYAQSETLLQAIRDISERYNVHFTYDREIVENVEVKDYEPDSYSDVDDALSSILKGTNLKYVMLEMKYVIIYQDDAAGMKSLEQMVGVLQKIIEQKKKKRLVSSIDRLRNTTDLSRIHLEKHRMVLNVSGTVTDQVGEPLIGVNVLVKGTIKGTATDFEGQFVLEDVNENATLVFSYVGYQTKEFVLNGRSNINITMVEDSQMLDEVVVIGYGTQKKSDLTGSIVRADIESFREAPNVSIVQSLQGTIPGLNIGQVDEAGETPSIQIRGRSTLNGNRHVLIVLDGIIFTGSLNDLNPNDIESIDVLKDPSSKSIYGAQAANGVMLITSKKGKKSSKPIFHYSGSLATQNPTTSDMVLQNRDQNIKRIFDMNWQSVYQAPEYTELKPGVTIEDIPLSGSVMDLIKSGEEYDWWENTTEPGYIMNHNLGMQARKDDISYFISLGYTKQKGYILNDEYERIATRLNLSNEITKWLEIGVQSFGTFSDFSGSSPNIQTIRTLASFSVPYNENGEIKTNPVGDAIQNPFLPTLSNDFDKKNNLFANFYTDIDFPFMKGLNYRVNFGNNYIWNQHYFDSEFIGVSKTGRAYKNNSHKYDWTLDHILSYKKILGASHSLDLTLLYGMRKVKYESTANKANSFTNILSGYNDIGLGGIQTISSSAWQESFLYQMARLNYGFKARYMLTATIRRDGFSGFSKNEKTSLFPSMGVSWILSEEPFLDNEWIDFLKLRTSYGTNGNLTNRYSSLSKIDIYPAYVFGEGSSTNFGQEIDKLGNSNLKWEVTHGYNFGLDFSILKTRLSGSIDYYYNTTSDLLFNVSIPSITGFNSIQTNVGEIQNKGIELILDYDVVANPNFNWNINFNISHNENKIISLIGLDADNDGVEDDLVGNNLFIGHSINSVFTYESDGLIQIGDEDIPKGFSVGTHRIVDQNNDGFYDPDDRVIIGRKEPAYRLGLMNAFSYKGFNFRFFINSVQGGKDGYLGSVAPPTHPSWEDYNNMMRSNFVNVDYWTPSNPNAKYSLPGVSSPIRYQYFENRSFIRIQDVILGYDINPKLIKSIGFSSGKVYISGKNMMTITDWGGWDPETGTGLQRDARPVLKAYSIGLNFSF